ncbi:helix-turn-helix transcriptional regulator [Dyella sp. ASV21]|uniref:helix-turn-helix domain-containing protein n=1 Tax=Dyella sp. ASV21 TaxID=2795114 RepID=UPI0018EABA6D|nr:helix-turn-helix transcriptional regulator [Dyella sp. ASV21]
MSTKRTLPRKPAREYAPRSINRPEYEAVRGLLYEIRVEAQLTQIDLGQALKRNQTYVSSVERGIVRTDALQLLDWCRACGITLERFGRRLELKLGYDS